MGKGIRLSVGPKILHETRDFYNDQFKTCNAGYQYVLDALPGLYTKTLLEITGVFGYFELELMKELYQKRKLIHSSCGEELLTHILKSGNQDLIAKFQDLTIFQRTCLEIWSITDNKISLL